MRRFNPLGFASRCGEFGRQAQNLSSSSNTALESHATLLGTAGRMPIFSLDCKKFRLYQLIDQYSADWR
jgi:hypothetical protein